MDRAPNKTECDLDGKRLDTVSFRCSPEVRQALLDEAEQYGTTSSSLACTVLQRHFRAQSLLRTHGDPRLDTLIDEFVEIVHAAREDGLLDKVEERQMIDKLAEMLNFVCNRRKQEAA